MRKMIGVLVGLVLATAAWAEEVKPERGPFEGHWVAKRATMDIRQTGSQLTCDFRSERQNLTFAALATSPQTARASARGILTQFELSGNTLTIIGPRGAQTVYERGQ